MKLCSFRMRAISTFIFDPGMSTRRCFAPQALGQTWYTAPWIYDGHWGCPYNTAGTYGTYPTALAACADIVPVGGLPCTMVDLSPVWVAPSVAAYANCTKQCQYSGQNSTDMCGSTAFCPPNYDNRIRLGNNSWYSCAYSGPACPAGTQPSPSSPGTCELPKQPPYTCESAGNPIAPQTGNKFQLESD